MTWCLHTLRTPARTTQWLSNRAKPWTRYAAARAIPPWSIAPQDQQTKQSSHLPGQHIGRDPGRHHTTVCCQTWGILESPNSPSNSLVYQFYNRASCNKPSFLTSKFLSLELTLPTPCRGAPEGSGRGITTLMRLPYLAHSSFISSKISS